MKNAYDKILFVLALLVLSGSACYYFNTDKSNKQASAKAKSVLASGPQGEAWQEIKVPEIKFDSKVWEAAKAQSEDKMWLYQLFTPPKIWIDNEGKFVVQPPNSEKKLEQTFGYKFSGLKHEPYPVKYKGFFVIDEKGSPVYHVQLSDESNGRLMKGKVNEEITVFDSKSQANVKTGITIKNFEIKSVRDEKSSMVSKVYTVVLHDNALGRDITIASDKPTYIDESKALVLSSDGNDGDWEIKAVGDSRKTENSVYTVKELDMDNGVVVVEKVSVKGDLPPQKMMLSKDGNKLLK